MENPTRPVSELFRAEDDFLVAAHASPDGDAIGSTVAVGFILKVLGKRFSLYNASGVPSTLDWLPLPSPVLTELPETMPAWTIVVDCGDGARVGSALAARLGETRVVNIDHHLGNPGFGEVDWVDVSQPAVGCMVAELARSLGVDLTGPLAEAVYLAVATDTGFFQFGNTTPECLELAADLIRGGLDAGSVSANIRNQLTLPRIQLWSEVMATIQVHFDGAAATVRVTQEMLERTGTTPKDTEGIINFVSRLKGVRFVGILREDGPMLVKFSLRSQGTDDVQKIAAAFGGGGHRNASGGHLRAALGAAHGKIVTAIGETLGAL